MRRRGVSSHTDRRSNRAGNTCGGIFKSKQPELTSVSTRLKNCADAAFSDHANRNSGRAGSNV